MELNEDFDFQKVLKTVFQKLKDDDKEDYEKIEHDHDAEVAVEKAMDETYKETIKMMENATSLNAALAHLSPLRQEFIKSAFRCQSFYVDIKRQTDGTVKIMYESMFGSKLSFLPSVVTLDESNYEENKAVLIARIVLEIIVVILSFIGVSSAMIDKAIPEALKVISATIISSDRIIGDVEAMVRHAKDGQWQLVATDVISVIIHLFAIAAGPVIRVIKILIQNLSWFSILIIVCQALCFIAITFLSGGAAILAKAISWVLHASFFVKKLIQMDQFNAITFPKK